MLKEYLKYRKQLYILLLSFIVIEELMFSLIHLSLEMMIYLCLVWTMIMIGYGIYDYFSFVRKHKEIIELKYSIDTSLERMSVAKNLYEEDYQNIITLLYQQLQTLKVQDYNKYQDMINYYTMWVHQIKTPISALKLLIQSQDQNQEMMLEVLKIEQYVNMVLQYLRIEDMNHDYYFQKVSLDHLVSEVLKKQVTFFSQQKISLDYQIQDIQILTDEKWSAFVLEQILSNALKYTKQGKISIYNKKEKLYIQDTGMGIKKEDLPRVFERGFTGFQGRQDKRASGLGLYLTKRILDNLGHQISIESIIDKGTCVCIDFYKKKIVVE